MGVAASVGLTTRCSSDLTGGALESPAVMPLFRRQSEKARKKLQHQMYLAKESPDKTFDISGCELTKVPSGVYALCKVLQKEALLIHDNNLGGLQQGGDLQDLRSLRVLDLHCNELTHLPDGIELLQSLQVLNVEQNRLKSLPPGIGKLHQLQTLLLKGNKIHMIPDSMCEMQSLRTLDVSSNLVTELPQHLCQVRTLDSLILDAPLMNNPPAVVCMEGTESIMKFLCSKCDLEYIPPSKYVLRVLEPVKPIVSSQSHQTFEPDLPDLTAQLKQYENMQRRRTEECVALERQLREDEQQQAAVAALKVTNTHHLVEQLAQDQARLKLKLDSVQHQKDSDTDKLLATLKIAEENATQLVQKLLEVNQQAEKAEHILEKLETQRMREEQWMLVRQEEEANLRKKDVLSRIQQMLAENEHFARRVQEQLTERDMSARRAQQQDEEEDDKLASVLDGMSDDRNSFVQELVKQEALQIKAFEELMRQKDAKHSRLSRQIELVEAELSHMTCVEREQKRLHQEMQMTILATNRKKLAEMLMQLLEERERREAELKKRLVEMEQAKLDTQTDYWLVQYQRLMDRKPDALIDMTKQMEYSVIEILEKAGASDHIPRFACNKISIETMLCLTDSDMKQMGVHELGLRRAILAEIDKYKSRQDEIKLATKLRLMGETEDEWLVRPPPPLRQNEPAPGPSAPPQPTAPPLVQAVTARGINSECVVCMNAVSLVLFLNCGHVCCCVKCAEPLSQCPLCRGAIIHRITLQQPAAPTPL
ncbi:hypothetical protein NP493_372g05009 [Ridgeia piscesae]|uniref:E3 ubiquitin-protein ligase LRSAM1 n=1 Tax=Ridgeia piscesae TaxID=27915 RepID=A0AAD9NTP5_RIDPI|nr:hypothetical protein NP493_372g05009 [Ridgeia piscesae]